MKGKEVYEGASVRFWTSRKEWTVIGDWLGRLPALELLNPRPGEVIVDAGCGEGRLTQCLAHSGARVLACDRAEIMLDRARERNQADGLAVEHVLADICQRLPYEDGAADAVFCVAVLIHASEEECGRFFREARRVLKSGGRLVVSIMHPFLFQPESPNRQGRASWAIYRPVFPDCPLDRSQPFEEDYMDVNGEVFTSTVWYHPEKCFPRLMGGAGLTVVRRQDMYVRPEDIARSPYWEGSGIGYPAFYQIKAVS